MWANTYEIVAVGSPSPRKAWIETRLFSHRGLSPRASPSPRKAWIETVKLLYDGDNDGVAFPPEGVD